ncbi:NADH-quinone oxidoreductase subunit H [Candidatus Woesearchaeota archaeon]|nr:NADH-quinone oxidoreductase subunit H [Candidatus Woesearchaeota archaeon]
MNTSFVLFSFLNILLALLVSPLFIMLIKKVKAMAQGRRGPSLWQGYYNLGKLLKKEVLYSPNASFIMRITPYINLMVMIVAILFVPLTFIPQPVDAIGNIILFLYLLALGKFFMALAGLDAGSTFGGMGSSREMTFSAILEPVAIMVFAALAFIVKTTNIHTMFLQVSENGLATFSPSLLLLSIPLFIVLIVETARIPVDNPETHLELTMIHEAMILEQSGKNLALMELSHAIKQTLLMGLLINIFFPWGIATTVSPGTLVLGIISFFLKGVVLCVILGIFESSIAKLRLFRLPSLFMIAFFLSFITILLEVFA